MHRTCLVLYVHEYDCVASQCRIECYSIHPRDSWWPPYAMTNCYHIYMTVGMHSYCINTATAAFLALTQTTMRMLIHTARVCVATCRFTTWQTISYFLVHTCNIVYISTGGLARPHGLWSPWCWYSKDVLCNSTSVIMESLATCANPSMLFINHSAATDCAVCIPSVRTYCGNAIWHNALNSYTVWIIAFVVHWHPHTTSYQFLRCTKQSKEWRCCIAYFDILQ